MQRECPYAYKEDCPYDTSYCMNFKKEGASSRHVIGIVLLLILSIACSVFHVLIENKVFGSNGNPVDLEVWMKMLSPIANSIIAAVVCAIVMDIPSRMMEYQKYFVSLLSSYDYLKSMTEGELVKLRNKVTLQLHLKDVPNMPKGLIDLDSKILNMLKTPYFKTYSQTISVSKVDNNDEFLLKKIKVEYIAYNPYSKEHPTVMDIGFASSLKFPDGVSAEKAEFLFKMKQFEIYVDDGKEPVDFLSYINVLYAEKEYKGLPYNGVLQIAPKETNLEHIVLYDIDTERKSKNGNDESQKDITKVGYLQYDGCIKPLNVQFRDKIQVTYEYELIVPKEDVSSTKRLRYPVKYFYQDYSMNPDLDYQLVGQLIGTLIDQNDVSIENLDNNRRLCIRTHNWLLPKNGTMIVHVLDKKS